MTIQSPETIELFLTMPEDSRAVFVSTTLSRRKRMSLLVEWFQVNWWRWHSEPVADKKLSVTSFAEGLSRALSSYNIVINRQRVWTWSSMRNLPRADNFHVMAEIATGWQLEFALLVLEILASDEPELVTD